jgi:Cu/Ag efflux protein CusF
MKATPFLLAAGVALASVSDLHAQRTKSTDATPCCAISALNISQKLVTAQDKAGKTFQFQVLDAALLRSLKVGQAVFADFTTGKVRIHGLEPCCGIVRPAEPAGNAGADPGEPCCNVTSIDAATGIVTARVTASGRVFRFQVKDAALLGSMKAGQKVFADFGTKRVRVHGSEPCCNILNY